MKNKDRVQNIKPFDVELHKSDSSGFEIWIISSIGGDYTRRLTTKIHFERWWLSYLASILWKVINKEQDSLANDIRSLKGE